MSRAPSTNTVQRGGRDSASSPSAPAALHSPTGNTTVARNSPAVGYQKGKSAASSPVAEEASDSSPSTDSNSEVENVSRQAFRRAPPFLKTRSRPNTNEGDDEDEDEALAFLPVVQPNANDSNFNQKRIRMEDGVRQQGGDARLPVSAPAQASRETRQAHAEQSPASSASSQAALAPEPVQSPRPLGALSPRRAAELSGRSPRRRAAGRPGSDGTPSMGSSFSDLDGAPPIS